MKRFLAVIISCLMLVALFTGCGGTKDEIVEAPAELEMDETTVAYAGGNKITMDEIKAYIHLLVPYVQQYTGADEGWESIVLSDGMTARDVLINMAIEQYRDHMALVDYVKEKGLYKDADMDAEFEALIESAGGEDAFNTMIETYNLKTDGFENYAAYSGAYIALMEDACTDEDADKIYNEEYITAKHILIQFEGRETEDAAYNEAIDLYDRAMSGESFEELIKNYGEDPGQDPETGYTFTVGTMVDEFYQGALALEEGEISEPVKTSYGYHVIKKYPNPGKDTEAYAESIMTIKNNATSSLITEEVYQSIIEPYPLTINESILSSIDLSVYTQTLDENVNYADGSVFNE